MTYSTRDSVDSDIAANGTKVYVLWAEDDPVSGYRDLFYRLSTNAGATWSTAKKLTFQQFVFSPAAIAASSSTVHIVCVQQGKLVYRKSTDNGGTWSKKWIYSNSHVGEPVEMGVNGNTIQVVFRAESETWPYGFLYNKRSTDNGVTWSAAKPLVPVSYNVRTSCSLAVSGKYVHVACVSDILHLNHLDMYYLRSTDYGATWKAPLQVASVGQPPVKVMDDSPYPTSDPSIIASGAYVHLFYACMGSYQYWTDELFYMRSTDYGLSWSPGAPITNEIQGYFCGLSAKAAAVSGSKVSVAYCGILEDYPWDPYIGGVVFKKSTDGGLSWEWPELVIPNEDQDLTPSMVYVPATGYFHLAFDGWVDDYHQNEVFYIRGK